MLAALSGGKLNSYPEVYAIGHRAIPDLLVGRVTVEEKIDGSQVGFGISETGELRARSKGAEIVLDHSEGMFSKAAETIKALAPLLKPGWIYRGEYLRSPRHNTIAYSRVPKQNIILFDVNNPSEAYWPYAEVKAEADRLGLEVVPLIYEGEIKSMDQLRAMLDRESILGGAKIEGVVVKNYSVFTREKKVALGKLVRDGFKEENAGAWKKSNPTPTDVVDALINQYKTEARWQKAVQHLRESGQLTDTPKDIGPLMQEAETDILNECGDDIKDALFKHFWPNIKRGATNGLPQWYKAKLADNQ
jgi:hypothetical protein